jgi:hypothetical protein
MPFLFVFFFSFFSFSFSFPFVAKLPSLPAPATTHPHGVLVLIFGEVRGRKRAAGTVFVFPVQQTAPLVLFGNTPISAL